MLKKKDLYYPTKDFKKRAKIKDKKIYQIAAKNPVRFWEKLAKELFWFKPWKKAFLHKPPYFQWFVGGKINITENCLDRNLVGRKNKVALIWEPEPVDEKPKTLTYQELLNEVNKFANALKKMGIRKGDRVGIYLPMIPEVVIAMLACARIGAVHVIVFSAFSPTALKVRLQTTGAKILITADGYYRRGNVVNLKENADEGVKKTGVKKVIVVRRAGNKVRWSKKRDLWWHDLVSEEKDFCQAKVMDSEDLLFILPTSGSTGKPKAILHTCGGYTVQANFTGKWIFDFHEDSVLWCTADVGWITGHSYGVYSPLLNGITTLIYEGAPDWPAPDRWAKIIEKHKVTIFYTAPTAIRMFVKYGAKFIKKYQFKSLRLLGSVGEPIDEFSWLWYFREVGKEKCPIVDTWWQTETGGILITSLPGIGPFKPAFVGLPFPGIKFKIKDGNLLILPPFSPGMLRGIYKDHSKYLETYWSQYGKKYYFTADGALVGKDGLIRIVGRVDDVIKMAGHRLSTGELEDAITNHIDVSECAVVGKHDEIRGEVPIAFVVSRKPSENLRKEIISKIRKDIGPIASPKEIHFVDDLPKTRSGKIMRRILKKLFTGEDLGDLSTLANPESVKKLKEKIN